MAILLTGCSASSDSETGPPSSGSQIVASVHGTHDAIDWRVDLVKKNTELCTLAVVQGKEQSFDCPPPVADSPPLNFSINDADAGIELVSGVATPQVSQLLAITKDRQRLRPELRSIGAVKFFAYAVRPGTALDLIARDSRGAIVASGHDKLNESG
ncbi:hypothetical protein [Actinomadura terrae]|uniref:hypothetical protein n=1 Tax=Actinomadura terrae TaxID=604353 RepID=UPI001FA73F0B|nr:hypothetical protein [Actinomadura terrae]